MYGSTLKVQELNHKWKNSAVIFVFSHIFRLMRTPLVFLWMEKLGCQIGLWDKPIKFFVYAKKEMPPLAFQYTKLSKHQHFQRLHHVSGDMVVRERQRFSSSSNLQPCPSWCWRPILSHKKNRGPCSASETSCTLLSLEGVNHNLVAENWCYGINTVNERYTNAVCSPVEDWGSVWPICKWRKMSV